MTPLTKKALLYGGGGLVAVIVLYYMFRKKTITSPITPVKPNNPVKPDVVSGTDFPQLVIAKQGTRLRAKPSTDSEILDTLDLGTMLYPDGSISMFDGVWYHTSEGWVRSDVVTLPDSYASTDDYYDYYTPEIITGEYKPNIDEMFNLSKSGSKMSFDL